MTYPEAHKEAQVKFEVIAAQTLDNFLPQEVDLYFNRAIRKLIDNLRPLLLSPRENSESRKATENLRTLLESHVYSSGDFTDETQMKGGYSVPLSSLDPSYEYFIAGRLSTDKDVYSLETTSIRDFYEHLETRHNIPYFRRGKIVERKDNLLVAIPDPDETADALELTYLGEFSRVSSKLVVDYTPTDGSGNDTSSIDIQGVSYDIPWNTDVKTTIDDFISSHQTDIKNNHNITTEDLDSKIRFTVFTPNVLESEFKKSDNSGSTVMTQSTETSRPDIPLPATVHEELVKLTVNIMRSDLPQAQNPQEQ